MKATLRKIVLKSRWLKEATEVVRVDDRDDGFFVNGDWYYVDAVGTGQYRVLKEGATDAYTVTLDDMNPVCTCDGWKYKREPCKACRHCVAVAGIYGDGRELAALQASVVA